MNDQPNNKWHLDRRVPLALIVTIAAQTFAAVWWASALNSRVVELERYAEQGRTDSRTLVKLEVLVNELQRIVNRMETAPRRP